MDNSSRVLAVDPGQKRIGVAVSDPTGTIANPLEVIEHQTRESDAQKIIEIAEEYQAVKIIIGQALDWDGSVSYQGKKSKRLAGRIRGKTDIPVILWNEYGSTKTAHEARLAMGLSRKNRAKDIDHLAATLILQSYLDAQEPPGINAHE